MKILWLSWKDISNPDSGGAEVVMHELCKRLVKDGHSVTILTKLYNGSSRSEIIDGIEIIRIGRNRYIHPLLALIYYVRNLRNKFDVVIEVVNTAPYMSPFFKGNAKSILFYHQLARQIWFYESPFPVSLIGYMLLEPFATYLLSKTSADVITVSSSTKKDLMRFGFRETKIQVIPEGIKTDPLRSLGNVNKLDKPTLLSFGAMRAMKRTIDHVKAFEIAKEHIPDLQLIMAGDMSGSYGNKVAQYIKSSKYKDDISCRGKVSDSEKISLLRRCHILLETAVKEGWCLVVTEAASQGMPAVVYDVDGLRDSVKNNETGIISTPDIHSLAASVVELEKDDKRYNRLVKEAWDWSKLFSFDRSYAQFKNFL